MATVELKQHLETMIKALIAEDQVAADQAFAAYIRGKSKSILGEEDDEDEKKENPFAKKDDEDEGEEDSKDDDKDEDDEDDEEDDGEDE